MRSKEGNSTMPAALSPKATTDEFDSKLMGVYKRRSAAALSRGSPGIRKARGGKGLVLGSLDKWSQPPEQCNTHPTGEEDADTTKKLSPNGSALPSHRALKKSTKAFRTMSTISPKPRTPTSSAISPPNRSQSLHERPKLRSPKLKKASWSNPLSPMPTVGTSDEGDNTSSMSLVVKSSTPPATVRQEEIVMTTESNDDNTRKTRNEHISSVSPKRSTSKTTKISRSDKSTERKKQPKKSKKSKSKSLPSRKETLQQQHQYNDGDGDGDGDGDDSHNGGRESASSPTIATTKPLYTRSNSDGAMKELRKNVACNISPIPASTPDIDATTPIPATPTSGGRRRLIVYKKQGKKNKSISIDSETTTPKQKPSFTRSSSDGAMKVTRTAASASNASTTTRSTSRIRPTISKKEGKKHKSISIDAKTTTLKEKPSFTRSSSDGAMKVTRTSHSSTTSKNAVSTNAASTTRTRPIVYKKKEKKPKSISIDAKKTGTPEQKPSYVRSSSDGAMKVARATTPPADTATNYFAPTAASIATKIRPTLFKKQGKRPKSVSVPASPPKTAVEPTDLKYKAKSRQSPSKMHEDGATTTSSAHNIALSAMLKRRASWAPRKRSSVDQKENKTKSVSVSASPPKTTVVVANPIQTNFASDDHPKVKATKKLGSLPSPKSASKHAGISNIMQMRANQALGIRVEEEEIAVTTDTKTPSSRLPSPRLPSRISSIEENTAPLPLTDIEDEDKSRDATTESEMPQQISSPNSISSPFEEASISSSSSSSPSNDMPEKSDADMKPMYTQVLKASRNKPRQRKSMSVIHTTALMSPVKRTPPRRTRSDGSVDLLGTGVAPRRSRQDVDIINDTSSNCSAASFGDSHILSLSPARDSSQQQNTEQALRSPQKKDFSTWMDRSQAAPPRDADIIKRMRRESKVLSMIQHFSTSSPEKPDAKQHSDVSTAASGSEASLADTAGAMVEGRGAGRLRIRRNIRERRRKVKSAVGCLEKGRVETGGNSIVLSPNTNNSSARDVGTDVTPAEALKLSPDRSMRSRSLKHDETMKSPSVRSVISQSVRSARSQSAAKFVGVDCPPFISSEDVTENFYESTTDEASLCLEDGVNSIPPLLSPRSRSHKSEESLRSLQNSLQQSFRLLSPKATKEQFVIDFAPAGADSPVKRQHLQVVQDLRELMKQTKDEKETEKQRLMKEKMLRDLLETSTTRGAEIGENSILANAALTVDEVSDIVAHINLCEQTDEPIRWDLINDIVFPDGIEELPDEEEKENDDYPTLPDADINMDVETDVELKSKQAGDIDDEQWGSLNDVGEQYEDAIDSFRKQYDLNDEAMAEVIAHLNLCEETETEVRWDIIHSIIYPEHVPDDIGMTMDEVNADIDDGRSAMTEGLDDDASWFSIYAEFDECGSSLTFLFDGEDVKVGKLTKRTSNNSGDILPSYGSPVPAQSLGRTSTHSAIPRESTRISLTKRDPILKKRVNALRISSHSYRGYSNTPSKSQRAEPNGLGETQSSHENSMHDSVPSMFEED